MRIQQDHASECMEWLPIAAVGAMRTVFVIDGFTCVMPRDLFDGTVIQLPRYLGHLMQLLYQQEKIMNRLLLPFNFPNGRPNPDSRFVVSYYFSTTGIKL